MQAPQSPQRPGQPNQAAPGFWRRMAAVIYDSLLLLAVLFLATTVALPFNAGEAFSADQVIYPLYLVAVSFVFYGWFWTHGGQTLGLRSWKMRLVDRHDNRAVGWRQALLRYLAAVLSWLCLGMGFVWILIDKKNLAWHDYLSGTRLILTEKKDS
ncbi:RDD family protein [Methylomarinum sp. Ch1-1]|uniref:RDD family protein n=1 Tax=Methylomarinum roseum TaxID=3067653 RepID=A0AAU7NXW8_9GAMM